MRVHSIASTLFVLLLMPTNALLMGAHCNTRNTIDQIRQVHTGVRGAFQAVDTEMAPRLEDAGDRCIAQARDDGLTDEAGMASWRECMEPWNRLTVAISTSREVFASLEQVYDDIEAGTSGESNWRFWATQAASHGRTILRIIGELREDLDSLDGFRVAIEQLCDLIGCEGD